MPQKMTNIFLAIVYNNDLNIKILDKHKDFCSIGFGPIIKLFSIVKLFSCNWILVHELKKNHEKGQADGLRDANSCVWLLYPFIYLEPLLCHFKDFKNFLHEEFCCINL